MRCHSANVFVRDLVNKLEQFSHDFLPEKSTCAAELGCDSSAVAPKAKELHFSLGIGTDVCIERNAIHANRFRLTTNFTFQNVTVWGQPGRSTLIGLRASSMGWNWSSVWRFLVSKRMMP